VTKSFIKKLNKFFSEFDVEHFSGDIERQFRFVILSKAIDARINYSLKEYEDLVEHVLSSNGKFIKEIEDYVYGYGEEDDDSSEILLLSDNQIKLFDNKLTGLINSKDFSKNANKMMDVILKFQNGDYEDLQDFLDQEALPCVGDMFRDFKNNKQVQSCENDFCLEQDSLASVVEKTIEIKKNPGSVMKTGIKALNNLLGGRGYECGRVYLALGLSGQWKSGFLLNSLIWANRYSEGVKTFDKSKKPAYLSITLENDINETVERLYSALAGNGDIEKTDTTNVVKQFYKAGFNPDHSQVFIKYRANRSIDSDDIENMIEEISDEGYEVRGVIVDYTSRLESISREKEERFRLGEIINNLSTLAKEKNIPVVTAAQLNREAMKKIEEMAQVGKANFASSLQASHVGEAWSMIQNSDVAFIITPEVVMTSGEEIKYLGFNRIKQRGKQVAKSKIFYQPFEEGNDMRLKEDYDLKESLSLEKLGFGEGGDNEQRDLKRPKSAIVSRAKKKPPTVQNNDTSFAEYEEAEMPDFSRKKSWSK
jgi:hypothetical protein